MEVLETTDVVEVLKEFRGKGMARCIGLSGKTAEAAGMALEWADAVMVEYHTEDRSHEKVIEEAGRRDAAVFVKKPLASGAIPPTVAIPFILERAEVSTLVIGGLSLEHMRENVKIAGG